MVTHVHTHAFLATSIHDPYLILSSLRVATGGVHRVPEHPEGEWSLEDREQGVNVRESHDGW